MFETYPFPCRNIRTILSYQRLFICNEFTIDATPGSLPPPRHKRRGERGEAQRLGNELGKLPIHHAGFPDADFLGYTFFDVEARKPEGGERIYVYAIGNRSEVRLTFYEQKTYAYANTPRGARRRMATRASAE